MTKIEAQSANRSTALAVALTIDEGGLLEGHPAEAKQLLDALGLLDDSGHALAPDPAAEAPQVMLQPPGGAKGGLPTKSRLTNIHEPPRRPETFTSPPALRNLPPTEKKPSAKSAAKPAPKVIAAPPPPQTEPRAPKAAAPRPEKRNGALAPPTPDPMCGVTLGGRSRHTRLGEGMCQACREFFNAYQRVRKDKLRDPTKVRRHRGRPDCGTASGAKAHIIRGEQVCQPCLEARRVDNRERWHRTKHRRREQVAAQHRARRAEQKAAAEQGSSEAQAS